MTIPFFRLCVAAVAAIVMSASAVAAPILNLYYDPATGNLKLQNTTSGTQAIQSFDIITLGNGSLGPATGNNQGYLSTGTATLPAASFITSNTSAAGYNGVYSQAAASNLGSAIMTLQPYAGWSVANPIGPVGSYFDLGNIAVTGMTQADLDARFLTDPEGTPPNFDAPEFGKFLFSYEETPGNFSVTTPGDVVAVVPEPATLTLLAVAAGFGGLGIRRRRLGGHVSRT